MLDKELEILKHLKELYNEDVTDEAFLEEMRGKETQIKAWRDAFEGYFLRDVLNIIDEYFATKNNRTPPRISQIKAMLNAQNIHDEREMDKTKVEKVVACYGLRYQQQDKEEGNMHWFVPDYLEVEELIRQGKFGFVHDYWHPTHEEFTRSMEYWCYDKTGHKYRFYSDNDIRAMTPEQQDALWEKCHKMADGFLAKCNIKIN